MGKSARLRAERKAAGEVEPQRPKARRVLSPKAAKEKRLRQAAAFRKFQQLPLAERRAPLKGSILDPDRETTPTPHPNTEKEASA